jgi:hypothetical protein
LIPRSRTRHPSHPPRTGIADCDALADPATGLAIEFIVPLDVQGKSPLRARVKQLYVVESACGKASGAFPALVIALPAEVSRRLTGNLL